MGTTVDLQEVCRFLGSPFEEPREVDTAAFHAIDCYAAQLPDYQDSISAFVKNWHEVESPENLAAVVAPFLLAAAYDGRVEAKRANYGDLTRSAYLLGKAHQGRQLNLQEVEFALRPLVGAHANEQEKAIDMIAEAYADDRLTRVLKAGCRRWLKEDGPMRRFSMMMMKASIVEWELMDEEDGTPELLLESAREWMHGVLAVEKARVGDLEPAQLQWLLEIESAFSNFAWFVGLLNGTEQADIRGITEMMEWDFFIDMDISKVGFSRFRTAVAKSWSESMPGLTREAATEFFEGYWFETASGVHRTMNNIRTLNRNLTMVKVCEKIVADCRWMLEERIAATFPSGKMQHISKLYNPSFRLIGKSTKVPWFFPKETVLKALENEKALENKEPGAYEYFQDNGHKKANWRPNKLKWRPQIDVEWVALRQSGGRCMYCGGTQNLQICHIWPREIGGTIANDANWSMSCEVCKKFMRLMGPKAFGEALLTTPKQTAEIWWDAQAEANRTQFAETVNLLQDAPDMEKK